MRTIKALEIMGSCRGSEEDVEGVDREIRGEPKENVAWKAEEENPKGPTVGREASQGD